MSRVTDERVENAIDFHAIRTTTLNAVTNAKLSAKQRSANARKAARKRWAKRKKV